MNPHRLTRIATLLAASLLTASCGTIDPTAFTRHEIEERVVQDEKAMYADQEPITSPITFQEAAARALKYNLDYRLKLMENSLSKNLYDVSKYEMLPRLVAGAGYISRNNDSGGTSVSIETGEQTLSPSTSQQRHQTLANLSLSWNLLDFGVSYYRAQQKADQVLMADERRRKVVQNVLQDVRNSNWRALGAQRLLHQVDGLLGRVRTALQTARRVEREGLMPRAQVLAYQRALLDAVNLLSLRRQDLELAKAELAALMSVPPGVNIVLADDTKIEPLPPPPGNVTALESLALRQRPEIMEEWYRKRVTENDIKAAKLLVWPNVSFDISGVHDSNIYLYNQAWIDTGLRVSWNIMKLAQLPALERAQESQNKTDDMRRMALSMAVLTQVRVGVQRYALSRAEFNVAEESLRVDEELLRYAQAAARTTFDSDLEVIRAEARALLSRYQHHATYSNAQAAWGRVYNSVGLDVMPEAIESHDIKALAAAIDATLRQWEKNVLTGPAFDLKESAKSG